MVTVGQGPAPETIQIPWDWESVRAERARRHLRIFVEQAWPILEPVQPFVPNWHLDAICAHLEALTAGQLLDPSGRPTRSLAINIPPRSMKSLIVSVFWPVWEWITHPEQRYLTASYAQDLATRDSLKSRRVIESPWYQRHWGDVFSLTGDQNAKMRYENTKTGYRIATSVGGIGTGEGGSRLLVDDAHNVTQGESDAEREAVLRWWDESMSTRGNDPQTVCRVIVMQRIHERDLVGHVLEQGTYHHLVLPARYEPRVYVAPGEPRPLIQPHDDCPIAKDPRTTDGDLLWPARFPLEVQDAIERSMGSSYAIAGQMQQRPVPREGALFKSEDLRPLPVGAARRRIRAVLQFYDLAFSEKESADYTAGVTLGLTEGDTPGTIGDDHYVLHAWHERVDESRLDLALVEQIISRSPDLVGIEMGAFKQAATRDLVNRVQRLLAARRCTTAIIGVPVTADKVFRAQLPAARARAGLLYVDRAAPWFPAFEAELLGFPRAAHNDLVDCLSGVLALAIDQPAAPTAANLPLAEHDATLKPLSGAAAYGPSSLLKAHRATKRASLVAQVRALEAAQRV